VRSTSLMSRPSSSSQPSCPALPAAHPRPYQPLPTSSLPELSSLTRSHSCPFCSKKFYGSVDLERHKRTHTGEKPFACNFCSYRATQLGNLQRHINSSWSHLGQDFLACSSSETHPAFISPQMSARLVPPPLGSPHTKLYQCPLCPKSYDYRGSFDIHMRTHTGDTPFACPHCPLRTKDKNAEKYTFIAVWPRGWGDSDCLTSVSRSQEHPSTDKHLVCPDCKKPFAQKSDLERHYRIHTGEKPFACSICPYRATVKTSLQKHLRMHSGEKPYACPFCPLRSSDKSNLMRHIRSKHR
ncbi:Zinc finger protein 585B-like, partial [Homarus americanus]